jgi:cation:H+ antiporter
MNDYVALVLGFVIAGVGGELFVRGAVGLAKWARISPGIIGATVVAFATSSPELSVAVNAGMAGKPGIALGDALGSNVVNVSLILALALIVSGILCPRDNVKRDFPMAVLLPLVTGALALDGQLSRIDGVLLLLLFLVWLLAAVHEVRKQRQVAEEDPVKQRGWLSAVWFAMGLGLLLASGTLIVSGAQGIAHAFGIEAFVIGATIVAVGTSVPELATAVIAKIRGHDEVGLGTVLGSNIFNGGFIVAVTATLSPITVSWREVIATLVFGVVALGCAYPNRYGFIERRRGVLLLILYAVYLATVLQQPPEPHALP